MKIMISKVCIVFVMLTGTNTIFTKIPIAQLMQGIQAQHVPLKTARDARDSVAQLIDDIPQDPSAVPGYEKEQNSKFLRCAKILYDNARVQLLEALLEIDNRMAYWQYQKDHPWKYFLSKSPAKWITGPGQEDEVENNLETLKSYQGELYALLGQLAEIENDFIQRYKGTFLTNYIQGYKWIDELINALARIKTTTLNDGDSAPFVVRAELLKMKLENVYKFKDDLLADIDETAIPGYLARNWLRMSGLTFALGYGYNKGVLDQLQKSSRIGMESFIKNVVSPVEETVKDIVTPGWQNAIGSDGTSNVGSYVTKLELAKKGLAEMGKKYGLEKEAQEAERGLDVYNYAPFEKFLEKVLDKGKLDLSFYKLPSSVTNLQGWLENLKDYGKGLLDQTRLEGAYLARQYAAVGKVVLLIPAALAAGIGGYAGSIGYTKLTEKNYGPLRRALVDVASLFVDVSKPLDDEQYGKMVYLIYNLKKQATKELPRKRNIQADFIHDLERIESREFNVAAKRAIVEDMFKKYDFLGLIQKK